MAVTNEESDKNDNEELLSGGSGDDTLRGGAEDDTLIGGHGYDQQLAGEYEAFQRLSGHDVPDQVLNRIVNAASERYRQHGAGGPDASGTGLSDKSSWRKVARSRSELDQAQLEPAFDQTQDAEGDTFANRLRSMDGPSRRWALRRVIFFAVAASLLVGVSIQVVRTQLTRGTYQPLPLPRVEIPKANGKMRPDEPGGLLRSLVETERMTFYLPPIEGEFSSFYLPPIVQQVPEVDGGYRDSSWDFRALDSITDSVKQQRSDVDFQTEETDPRTIDWGKLLAGDDDHTYCSIGSPLVTALSSYMLGKMFDVDDPFSEVPRGGKSLPFYFSCYPKEDLSARPSYTSAFALSPNDLRNAPDHLLKAIRQKRAEAFCFGSRVFPVWLEQFSHAEYGVIVAQRRGPRAIWLVIAGTSGPGTLACAEILPKIRLKLPDYDEGEVSPVLYAVVKSVVEKDASKQFGDTRKARDVDFVEPTPLYHYR